jgi:hypothetical protein
MEATPYSTLYDEVRRAANDVCLIYRMRVVRDTNKVKVLYDMLEMGTPNVDLVFALQKLETDMNAKMGHVPLRKRILMPNSKHAYLSKITFGQFGEGGYRVFYNYITQAIRWLEE